MSCVKLMSGLDIACEPLFTKYYQNIVLINKSDVESFIVTNYDGFNNVRFSLKAGKTGYAFNLPPAASNLSASFSKSEEQGIPVYSHLCSLPIAGTTENIKVILKQLDQTLVFAAIKFMGGSIEIYGWDYGLKTDSYDYQPQGGIGGAIIPLRSSFSEYDPPYMYNVKDERGAAAIDEDYENNFANIPNVNTGDFNNDYNDDFNIE